MNKKIILINFLALIILFVFGFYVPQVLADWIGPSTNPPDGNMPELLNVSDQAQTKAGKLTVDALEVIGECTNCGGSGGLDCSAGLAEVACGLNVSGQLSGLGAIGVKGKGDISPTSKGVWGESNSNGGYGVYGYFFGNNGTGVRGHVVESTSTAIDALAESSDSYGLYSMALGGNSYGLYTKANGTNSVGVYAEGQKYGLQAIGTGTNNAVALKSQIGGSNGTAVFAEATTTSGGYGVYSNVTGKYGIGLLANAGGYSGTGIYAIGDGIGLLSNGNSYGVRGETNSPSGIAGYFWNSDSNNSASFGTSDFSGVFNGNVSVNGVVTGTKFVQTSDERFKENISNSTLGSAEISKLNPVNYNFIGKDNTEIGLIAQAVEKIIPQVVYTDEAGFKYVDYSALVPVLIKSNQEQQLLIDNLIEENKLIKARLDKLEQ